MIVPINCRAFAQETLCIFAGPINRIDKTQFHFPVVETFSNYFDVAGMTSSILNLAPAEDDLTIHSEQKCLFAFGVGRFGNVFAD